MFLGNFLLDCVCVERYKAEKKEKLQQLPKLGVSEKIKKPKKSKKLNCEKKSIKILKKPIGSVRFWFYKTKTKKTEPKPKKIRKKTESNQFLS